MEFRSSKDGIQEFQGWNFIKSLTSISKIFTNKVVFKNASMSVVHTELVFMINKYYKCRKVLLSEFEYVFFDIPVSF